MPAALVTPLPSAPAPAVPRPWFRDPPTLALALLVAGLCVWAWGPAVRQAADPMRLNDDQRQWIAMFHRYYDPQTLQGDDAILDARRALIPLGYGVLLRGIAQVAPPLQATKWLGLALGALSVVPLALIGRRVAGRGGALAVVAIAVYADAILGRVAGGNQRAFAFPVVCWALWCAGRGKPHLVAWLSVAGALFYPPAMAMAATLYVLLLAHELFTAGWGPATRRTLAHGVVAGVLALAAVSTFGPAGGGRITFAEAQRMPSLHAGGRYAVLPLPPVHRDLADAVVYAFSPNLTPARAAWVGLGVLGALLVGWFVARGWESAPLRALASALFAGVLLYVLARLVAFTLFLPDRYLAYLWPPAVALGWVALWAGVSRRVAPARWQPALVPLLAFGGAVLVGGWGRPGQRAYHVDGRYAAELWAVIRTLPPDALVSGDPALMDDVFAFGHRRVYVTVEMADPLQSREYWAEMRRRFRRNYEAYYAATPAPVRALHAEEGVDFLIVDRRDYGAARLEHARLFEPVTEDLRAIIAANAAHEFWLLRPPQNLVVAEVGPALVLDLRALDAPAG